MLNPLAAKATVHWRTTDRLRSLESWIQRFNLDYISQRLQSKRCRAEPSCCVCWPMRLVKSPEFNENVGRGVRFVLSSTKKRNGIGSDPLHGAAC